MMSKSRGAVAAAAAAALTAVICASLVVGTVSIQVELPALFYDLDGLEPFYSEQTLAVHHGKHHAGYTRKVNAALEQVATMKPDLADVALDDLLRPDRIGEVPAALRTSLVNNGGGYLNHKLFWEVMAPSGSPNVGTAGETSALPVVAAIGDQWGSVAAFKREFSTAGSGVFGSGWAWLVVDGSGDLSVVTTANQDIPYEVNGESVAPVLVLDVWEHAYYLDVANERGKYIASWWNVVSWSKVNALDTAATAGPSGAAHDEL